MVEHLDFDAVGEAVLFAGDGIGPEEDAGVAAGFGVHPIDFEDEVLVLADGAHDADGVAGADDFAIFDAPGLGAGVDGDPAGEVDAIEERDEAGLGVGDGEGREAEEGAGKEKAAHGGFSDDTPDGGAGMGLGEEEGRIVGVRFRFANLVMWRVARDLGGGWFDGKEGGLAVEDLVAGGREGLEQGAAGAAEFLEGVEAAVEGALLGGAVAVEFLEEVALGVEFFDGAAAEVFAAEELEVGGGVGSGGGGGGEEALFGGVHLDGDGFGFHEGGAEDHPGGLDDAGDVDGFNDVAGGEGLFDGGTVIVEELGVLVGEEAEVGAGEPVFDGVARGARGAGRL